MAGVVALLAGELWSQVLPYNKTLWTSSYVLWTGGWAMLALALLDVAIDLQRWPAIGRRLGVNAIAIYAGAWILAVVLDAARWKQPIYQHGFAWMGSPELASLAFAVAFTAFWWAVADRARAARHPDPDLRRFAAGFAGARKIEPRRTRRTLKSGSERFGASRDNASCHHFLCFSVFSVLSVVQSL